MADVLMHDTAAYLDAVSRRPWKIGGGADGWSGQDCTLYIADWSIIRTGKDPADDLRGTYATEDEATAIIERAGGYVPLMMARMFDAGWGSVKEASDGDVAVVSVRLGQGHHVDRPAIFHRKHWFVRWERATIPFKSDLHTHMIWSVR